VATPDFATHYHLAGRPPFLNLSDLDGEELLVVLAELDELGRRGAHHRPFGLPYISLRRRTEAVLRERFIAVGVRPERTAPHYFVLGESRWFAGLGRDTDEVRVPLTSFPADQTSITFPDSFVAMNLVPHLDDGSGDESWREQVYRVDQLDEVIATHGIPNPPGQDAFTDWRTWPAITFIEIQLWCDGPIGPHLAAAASPT